MEQVDAIFTSDWHVRDTTPKCRIDDFSETQWNKIKQVSELQQKYNCPVMHAGDVFDYWKPSPELLAKCILYFPKEFHTIYGNHDLPQHNLELAYKSGVYCLAQAKVINLLNGVHWGTKIKKDVAITLKNRKILVWHTMTYQGKVPFPGCKAPRSIRILKKLSDYDVILTGHNHKPFTETHANRLLVNPGALTRQTASDTFKPRVYLYNAKSNTVKIHYLEINDNAISTEHITEIQEKDNRIHAFISGLSDSLNMELDFTQKVLTTLEANSELKEKTKSLILQSINK